MAHKVKLYMFSGSTPCQTAQLMLEHKGIEHERVHVLAGPHAFVMLGRGFQTMTVPALKIDGRRLQGSRQISRELDELVPQPPLFPSEPRQRAAIEQAERRGEELQDVARRIFWCVVRRDPRTYGQILRHPSAVVRPAQRAARQPITWLATAGHRATDWAVQEDLAWLPARLDEIDAWIADGVLDGPELNAADFQVAPGVAALLGYEELAPVVEDRPVARLAQRVLPGAQARSIGAVLPAAWLAPLHTAAVSHHG